MEMHLEPADNSLSIVHSAVVAKINSHEGRAQASNADANFKVFRSACISPTTKEPEHFTPLSKLEAGGINGMMSWAGLTCNFSFIYDTRLDCDRLQAALTKVADAHPMLTGRMTPIQEQTDNVEDHHTSSLAVCTNGTGFPFIVASMKGMTLQQLISHGCYLHGLPFTPFGQVAVQGPEWMQTLDAAQIAAGASPLIAFRLTYLEGSSACILSMAASHAIVDGMRLFGVLTDVVAAYRYSCSIARRPTDRGLLHPEVLAACPHLDGQRIRAYLAAEQQQQAAMQQQKQQQQIAAVAATAADGSRNMPRQADTAPLLKVALKSSASDLEELIVAAPLSAPLSRQSSNGAAPANSVVLSRPTLRSPSTITMLAAMKISPACEPRSATASMVTVLLPEAVVLRLKAGIHAAAVGAVGNNGFGLVKGSEVSTNDVVNALLWMLRKEMAGLPLPGCSSPKEGEGEEEALNQTIDILANCVPESAVPPNYLGNAVCIMRTVAPVFEAWRGCRAQDLDSDQLKAMHAELSLAIKARLVQIRSDPLNALDMGLRWWRSSLLGSGSETMAGIRKGVTAISTNLTRVSGPALDFGSGAPVSSLLLTSPLQCAIPAPFNGISKAPYGDGVMLHMCIGELQQLRALEASHVLSELVPEAQILC